MTHPVLTRRHLLLGAAAAAMPLRSFALAPTDTLRIGQTLALSGPLADLGRPLLKGGQVCFAAVNAKGGVNGRAIDLVASDDGYNVQRAVSNVKAFLADSSLFALFGCMGTPTVEAVLPLLDGTDMPMFAPLTGATSARRTGKRSVFNIRASYPEETARLVEHLHTLGIRRLAIVAQHNSFGAEVAKAALDAVAKHQLDAVIAITVENDGSDAPAAAAKVAAAAPQAVLIGLAGKPTIDFVRAIRREQRGLPLYGLSVMGPAGMIGALKDDAYGIVITQVVPLPTDSVRPVVRDFLHAWSAHGDGTAPSHLALEGYINARVFVEALRRSGPRPTRAGFVDAAYGIKDVNLGGFDVGFSTPGRDASSFVELTMIGRNGKFVR